VSTAADRHTVAVLVQHIPPHLQVVACSYALEIYLEPAWFCLPHSRNGIDQIIVVVNLRNVAYAHLLNRQSPAIIAAVGLPAFVISLYMLVLQHRIHADRDSFA